MSELGKTENFNQFRGTQVRSTTSPSLMTRRCAHRNSPNSYIQIVLYIIFIVCRYIKFHLSARIRTPGGADSDVELLGPMRSGFDRIRSSRKKR